MPNKKKPENLSKTTVVELDALLPSVLDRAFKGEM